MDPLAIQNRQELAEFIRGRDDDELGDYLTELSVPAVLRSVFEGMAHGYLPKEGPREPVVVQWDIQDLDRKYHTWQNVASREGFTFQEGAVKEAAVTLRTELVPFVRLMAGELRGIQALSSGAVKLKGDVQMALEMEGWFAD